MLESPQVASPAVTQQRKPTAPTHMRSGLWPAFRGKSAGTMFAADTDLVCRSAWLGRWAMQRCWAHTLHLDPISARMQDPLINVNTICCLVLHRSPSRMVPIGAAELLADSGPDAGSVRSSAPSETGSLPEKPPDVRRQLQRSLCLVINDLAATPAILLPTSLCRLWQRDWLTKSLSRAHRLLYRATAGSLVKPWQQRWRRCAATRRARTAGRGAPSGRRSIWGCCCAPPAPACTATWAYTCQR